MVAKKLFADHSGKPQFQNDSETIQNLRQVLPDRISGEEITKLAALIIRYDYPVDLIQIAESWGMSLNSLMSVARGTWERVQSVPTDTKMSGSGWDSSAQD